MTFRPARNAWIFVVAAVVVVVVVAAAPARAADDDLAPLSLVPVPLARPLPRVVSADPTPLVGACNDGGLPMLRERLPFGPGESLSFDMRMLGVRAGQLFLRIDNKTRIDDVDVYPVQARARTDRFLAALGQVDASMVSFVDPISMRPVRMANRSVTRRMFEGSPSTTREDAAFGSSLLGPGGARGGKVAARIDHFGDGKSVNKSSRATSRGDVVDILSIVYWLRSRQLDVGPRFCFEMFHRRRLWRLEGTIGVVAKTASPFATRAARRIDLSVLRAAGKEPRPITVWLSDDDDRLPLLVTTTDNIEVHLTGFTRGRALVRPAIVSEVAAPLEPAGR